MISRSLSVRPGTPGGRPTWRMCCSGGRSWEATPKTPPRPTSLTALIMTTLAWSKRSADTLRRSSTTTKKQPAVTWVITPELNAASRQQASILTGEPGSKV